MPLSVKIINENPELKTEVADKLRNTLRILTDHINATKITLAADGEAPKAKKVTKKIDKSGTKTAPNLKEKEKPVKSPCVACKIKRRKEKMFECNYC